MSDFHHLNHVKKQCASRRTLWISLFLTVIFTTIEIIGGLRSHSLALLSDAVHMLSDVVAIILSLIAVYLATREPNHKFTFGYLRFEIIASFLNGIGLVIISLGILIEAIRRIIHPTDIQVPLMLGVSCIALVIHFTLTMILIQSMKKENNLNIQSALWHFIGDLINSVGVIISALIILFSGFTLVDPILGIVLSFVIGYGGFKIVRESYYVLMETAPEELNVDTIRKAILSVEEVIEVHELHVWTITTDHHSLIAHVFVSENTNDDNVYQVIAKISNMLEEKYGLIHVVIQVENPFVNAHGVYGEEIMMRSNFSAK